MFDHATKVSNGVVGGREILNLYKGLYLESKRLGVTHWLAAMEEPLVRLLRRFGFVFNPVGPEVDYYGHVRPYIANISEIEKQVCREHPFLFKFFIDNLEPHLKPVIARQ